MHARPLAYQALRELAWLRDWLFGGGGGSSPVYADYTIPGYDLRRLSRDGGAVPTFSAFRGNIWAYAFSGTGAAVEEGFFSILLNHDIAAGTTPTFRVDWSHNIAVPSGNVKWQIEYSLAKGYGAGTFPATTTVTSTQAVGAQYVHQSTPDADMPMVAAFEPDSVLLGRIFRDPADAADTFANPAFLLQVGLHYEIGQLGTAERNRPFTGF